MIEKSYRINGVDVVLSANDEQLSEMNRLAGIIQASEKIQGRSDRDLDLLVDNFKDKVKLILARCESDGYILRPFFTLRSVWKQARLWRQSRPTTDILKTIGKLNKQGAPFLAHVLKSVGPQQGRWATNALPGQSWHQYGEAVDCYLVSPEGKAIWAANAEGYKNYAEHAVNMGLTAGFYWNRRDAVHVQLRDVSVRTVYAWPEIDSIMSLRFQEPD